MIRLVVILLWALLMPTADAFMPSKGAQRVRRRAERAETLLSQQNQGTGVEAGEDTGAAGSYVTKVVNYLFHTGRSVKDRMLTTAEVADIIEQSLRRVSPDSAEDDSQSERWALDEAKRILLEYAADAADADAEDADADAHAIGELWWQIDQLGDERKRGGRFIELWPSLDGAKLPHVQVFIAFDATSSKLAITIPYRESLYADPLVSDTVKYPTDPY